MHGKTLPLSATCVLCALGLSFAALESPARAQTIRPTAQQRFQTQAPLAWSKLIELASCVEADCSATSRNVVTGKVEREGPATFRINGLLAYIPTAFTGKQRLLCQNLQYEFYVDETKNKQWTLRQLAWEDRSRLEFSQQPYWRPDGTIGRLPWQEVLAVSCRGVLVEGTWLPYLASLPSFKVVEESAIKGDEPNGDLVRIKFTNEIERDQFTITHGELTLATKLYWQIVKAQLSGREVRDGTRYDVGYDIENKFEVAANGLPYVATQTLHVRTTLVDIEYHYTTKITSRDRQDVKPFTLSAFGLPEPANPDQ